MWYYIKTEDKNPKYLTISAIQTRNRHTSTDKEYTNEEAKESPELNDMELGFIKSSNDIIYGELDEMTPDQEKVSGEI